MTLNIPMRDGKPGESIAILETFDHFDEMFAVDDRDNGGEFKFGFCCTHMRTGFLVCQSHSVDDCIDDAITLMNKKGKPALLVAIEKANRILADIARTLKDTPADSAEKSAGT